jgi:hypothetical protein
MATGSESEWASAARVPGEPRHKGSAIFRGQQHQRRRGGGGGTAQKEIPRVSLRVRVNVAAAAVALLIIGVQLSVRVETRLQHVTFTLCTIVVPLCMWFYWFHVRLATLHTDRLRAFAIAILIVALAIVMYVLYRILNRVWPVFGGLTAVILVSVGGFQLLQKLNRGIDNYVVIRRSADTLPRTTPSPAITV